MNIKYELNKINRVQRLPLKDFMVHANLIKDMVYIDIPDELIEESFKDKLHINQTQRLIQLWKDYDDFIEKKAAIREIQKNFSKEVINKVRNIKDAQVKKEKAIKNKAYKERWKREREEMEAIKRETESQMSKVKPRKKKKKPFWHE